MRPHLIAAARRRAGLDDDESGFMLIYVIVITTLVTILVTSAIVVTSSSVIPAVRATYNQAAEAAARGGVQAALTWLNTTCKEAKATPATCTEVPSYPSWATNSADLGIIFSNDTGYQAKYNWIASKHGSSASWVRVVSKGTVSQGGLTVSKTLVADIAGGASSDTLDFGVVTGFETESSSMVLARNPDRFISLDAASIAAAGVPIKGGGIHWSGASPGVAAGKVAVCNAPYTGEHGRANTPPPNAPNPYVDWTESGQQGNNYTNYEPCQVSFGHYTQLLAPDNPADGPGGYYSKDALLLSNSWPGGTGPLFNQPVSTAYRYNGDDPCGTPGQTYRSFNLLCVGYAVEVGGSPAPASQYGVSWVQNGPKVPSNTVNVPPAACVYTGPTRVKLNANGTATITSPQTTAAWVAANAATRPAQCYVGAGAAGLAAATISFSSPQSIYSLFVQNNGNPPPTTPALAHSSSGWPVTAQKLGATASTSNSVFYLSSGSTPTTPDTGTSAADDNCATAEYSGAFSAPCAWTNLHSSTDGNGGGAKGWMSYLNPSSTSCSSLVQTDRQQFECDYGGGTVTAGHDNYSLLRDTIQTALAQSTCTTGDAATQRTCLTALINTALATANTGHHPANYSGASTGDHQYIVSAVSTGTAVTPAATKVLSDNAAPASTDPLFESTSSPTVETNTSVPLSFTIGRQTYACYGLLGLLSCLLGGSPGWGNGATPNASTPQFTVTVSQSSWQITTAGAPGISSFPSMSDVTQYAIGRNGTYDNEGPGDLYVEGTSATSMALLAQNDVIFTGSTAPLDPATQALEIVAQDNGRIYHPVKCKSTNAAAIAATSPGFCPNDVTGLYTGVVADGYRPYQQYVNLRPDLANMVLRGAIFSIGNAPESITCPQPPQGGGVCGGEFTTDNYNRGTEMGTMKVIGSLAMAHHGPLGQEWDIPDVTGQSARPYSGYQYVNQYQNLKGAIITLNTDMTIPVLITTTTTSAMWHIVSYSTGTS